MWSEKESGIRCQEIQDRPEADQESDVGRQTGLGYMEIEIGQQLTDSNQRMRLRMNQGQNLASRA